MSREEQIEEMVKDLCDSTMCDLETYNNCRMPQGNCSRCKRVAKDLYDTGYRKASEIAREICELIEAVREEFIGMEYNKGYNDALDDFERAIEKKYMEVK